MMERSNSRCDATTLFASGIERLKAAQKELTLAQRNMEVYVDEYVLVGTMNQTHCYIYVMGMTITSYPTL